jgi:MoxR-like ATPase
MQLQETISAIRQADLQRRRRVGEELRRSRPVAQVDSLIQELEEIHLRGGIKVPAAMIPRVAALVEGLRRRCVGNSRCAPPSPA